MSRCCCGLSYTIHCGISGAQFGEAGEQWLPSRHTQPSPTDAYGTIEFQGGPHPSKAQYVRLAYDTRPDLLVQLFTREWNLELPKLLITVQGGKANFELQPKLKKVLRKGLLKAAKTTGAWIFTGGTNTGVTRQVGDALLLERSQRSGRVVSIGIAPWGIVENNHELIGHNRDVPYHSIASPRSKFAVLNNRHAYFLLVDNGTGGRYGAEIILRRKLEKYISIQKLHPYTHSSTPVVCLVIEGGTNTIRAVLEYVTDNPPVPVVVCDGSGRAADLIAFVHKYASESGEQVVLESMKDYLIGTIQRTFEVGLEQAECLYNELLQCTRKKNLITIFRILERPEGKTQELDQTILTALFKSQHLSPSEQLHLALTWNRVDIARSEIFVYGQEWPPGALDEAMMQALEHDRIDFVKLLLENGVSMRKFLTIPRLEELYNTKQGPTNTLGYILRDVRPHIPRGYMYTLHDIGLVINKLMGGAYRAYYTRRKFRPIYAKVMNKNVNVHRNSASFIRYYGGGNPLSLVTGLLPVTTEMALFDYPFNELMIWAVLTKRQQMALLMWTHGEEALAKSLVACKLYKAMAHEAAEDDLETEIYEELRNYGKEFEQKALELLDFCYRQDDDQTQQLLTCELQNWSGQTCLSLAVAANHRALLAHPCSQIILADLWMGGLRTRKNTNLKVILGLLFPFYIIRLEFKSKEELQLMPQTEEEHLENESLEDGQTEEKNPDAESNKRNSRSLSMKIKATTGPQGPGTKALLADNYSLRDTRVQENGKVGLTGLSDSESPNGREYIPLPLDYYELKQNRPLRLKKKLYEFFTAPITKFWADSLAYMFFLIMFTYTVLVKMEHTPSWQEYYSIAYICTLGCEKIREIVSSEPVAISHKFSVWAWNMWNPCDAATIILFLIGLSLRLKPYTMDIGRVIYCVDSIYWYLRILNILGVNKYLGPLVTMMGKMVKNMIYFVVLLLVVLMSFGVCRQAILHPSQSASWGLVRDVFFQPYFMLYGEVFADQIDPPCGDLCQTGRWLTPLVMSTYLLVANILLINLLIAVFNNIFIEVNAVAHQVFYQPYFMLYGEVFADDINPPCGENPDQVACHTGRWVTPIAMATYLLVANILLINLLIAVFNNIFNEVNAVSHQVWMFQRFTVVMEYEQKPVLPPPLIILSHLYLLLKYLKRKIKGVRETYDNGLKLFLEKDDMERLYDFEEECVEGYFREQEFKLNQSTEERVRNTTERVEHMTQKIEDINQKENSQITATQSVEFRLRKMEDVSEQILSHLAVIHRFMATHTLNNNHTGSELDLVPELRVPTDRLRRTSERSDNASDVDNHLTTLQVAPVRRRLNRSLTEVRPDAYIFDDGLHFEVRTVEEEEEESANVTMETVIAREECLTRSRETINDRKMSDNSVIIDHHSSTPTTPAIVQTPSTPASVQAKPRLDERQISSDSRGTVTGSEEDTMRESTEDILELNFEGVRQRTVGRRRNSSGGRRSSEGGTGPDGSERSLLHHLTMSRRQLSQTHSEPDNTEGSVHAYPRPTVQVERSVTWAEPRIKVIPPSTGSQPNPRSMLMAMHTEYTSITDELETVCGLLSPPRTPRLLSPPRPGKSNASPTTRRRNHSEMSNPEFALYIEKEHLRDAEESDYMLMENLIQRRYDDDETDQLGAPSSTESDNLLTVVNETREFRSNRNVGLRRSSAIEVRDLPTPCTNNPPSLIPVAEDESCKDDILPPSNLVQKQMLCTNSEDKRQNSAETNVSSELTSTGSFSHVPSEQAPTRPTITIDSSQLPLHRSLSKTDSKGSLTMQSETMC